MKYLVAALMCVFMPALAFGGEIQIRRTALLLPCDWWRNPGACPEIKLDQENVNITLYPYGDDHPEWKTGYISTRFTKKLAALVAIAETTLLDGRKSYKVQMVIDGHEIGYSSRADLLVNSLEDLPEIQHIGNTLMIDGKPSTPVIVVGAPIRN